MHLDVLLNQVDDALPVAAGDCRLDVEVLEERLQIHLMESIQNTCGPSICREGRGFRCQCHAIWRAWQTADSLILNRCCNGKTGRKLGISWTACVRPCRISKRAQGNHPGNHAPLVGDCFIPGSGMAGTPSESPGLHQRAYRSRLTLKCWPMKRWKRATSSKAMRRRPCSIWLSSSSTMLLPDFSFFSMARTCPRRRISTRNS